MPAKFAGKTLARPSVVSIGGSGINVAHMDRQDVSVRRFLSSHGTLISSPSPKASVDDVPAITVSNTVFFLALTKFIIHIITV